MTRPPAHAVVALFDFHASAGDIGDDRCEFLDQRIISLPCRAELRNLLGRPGKSNIGFTASRDLPGHVLYSTALRRLYGSRWLAGLEGKFPVCAMRMIASGCKSVAILITCDGG